MVFGQDAIYTYLRKMRYHIDFGEAIREDLIDLFGSTLDLRLKKHPVYEGALKQKSVETQRRMREEKKQAELQQNVKVESDQSSLEVSTAIP